MKTHLGKLLVPLIVAGCAFSYSSLSQADDNRLAGLDAKVERVMEMLSIPGLSIAVIEGDEVTYLQGYGVRESGSLDEVDESTLFAIGSLTKAFTATTLGLLVNDGVIDWNDPLANHLPEFRVADPYLSLNLSILDALSHRTGLDPANGLMMANTQIGRAGIMTRLAHLESLFPFRSDFVYNNLMYIVASEVIPRVSELTWEDAVQSRILDPLGMRDSIPNSGTAVRTRNLALPHALVGQAVRPVPYFDMTTAAPAGGILSSAKDMAQWCRAQLNDGKVGGEQKIAAGVIPATHNPVINARTRAEERFEYGTQFSFYAMGWSQRDYHSRLLVSHDGGINGMSAFVSMLPEASTCVVTLSNLSPAADPHLGLYSIHNWIHDRLTDSGGKDWVSHLNSVLTDLRSSREQQSMQAEAQRVLGTSPSLPLDKYVGVFYHPLQGDLVVTLEGGDLRFLYGENFNAKLEHWHFDTFNAHWDQPGQPPVPIQFQLDAGGDVTFIEVGDRFERISE